MIVDTGTDIFAINYTVHNGQIHHGIVITLYMCGTCLLFWFIRRKVIDSLVL